MAPSSTLLATAATYFQAMSNFDSVQLFDVLAENYEQHFAPGSAKLESPVGRDYFVSSVTNLGAVLSDFTTEIKKTWPNEAENQVTVWAEGGGSFHSHLQRDDDDEEWLLKREYIFVIVMDGTGKKIESVLEFFDNKALEVMKGLIGKAFQRLEQSAKK
nr:uncharacterized protein CTRU02_15373 [Colletotrichum truncatum]KAF6781156.1 hypothetical protein CTRU02_15373 [Colletotrichum truncatum]